MGTYSSRAFPSVSEEIAASYQELSTLLARLISDPGDIAAMQKLAAKQGEIERLESIESDLLRIAHSVRPSHKSHVA